MSGHEDIISDESCNGHDKDGIISRAMQYLFHQVCLTLRRTCPPCFLARQQLAAVILCSTAPKVASRNCCGSSQLVP